MTERRAYLDHNATAPLLPEARKALLRALEQPGNPSSVHAEGRAARALVEAARRSVAGLVGASPPAVTFTSGATEAATTCLSPLWIEEGREVAIGRLAVLDTDHPCIRDGGRFAPERVTRLPVDADGIVDLDALARWLDAADGPEPDLLALCFANNETGVIQPLDAITDLIGEKPVLLAVDAVQAVGRLPLDGILARADAVILSGHKIGAAKGVGAVALRRESLRPAPLLTGGGQEKRRRSGTEAVAPIASFGAAAEVAGRRCEEAGRLLALRTQIESRLESLGVAVVGRDASRLPNTVMAARPGLKAETAQMALDLAGFAVSSGSACSSGKVGPSHVLEAMAKAGAPVDPNEGAIRISFGYETGEDELDALLVEISRLVTRSAASGSRTVAA
ncbi:cysteine desulfurase family protein [Mangrovibrevibacter kandeliae]|uniref:cysteine desulfurase family protein n=1 Tax=Mangrovibrevibacter kandeliae TaxID=2968473 RepID=UPI0021178B69|nr:cysteine desulfurase [Aurantimonas sp. CSK15Z-1]